MADTELSNWHTCVRAARASGRARFSAGAGCSVMKYQSPVLTFESPGRYNTMRRAVPEVNFPSSLFSVSGLGGYCLRLIPCPISETLDPIPGNRREILPQKGLSVTPLTAPHIAPALSLSTPLPLFPYPEPPGASHCNTVHPLTTAVPCS